MGIKPLPADPKRVWGQKKRTLSEKLILGATSGFAGMYASKGLTPLAHHIVGLIGFALFLALCFSESRKDKRHLWLDIPAALLILSSLLWWRW